MATIRARYAVHRGRFYLMVIFTLKRGKVKDKILLYAFLLFVGCVDGVQSVCARIVAILHTETLKACDIPF